VTPLLLRRLVDDGTRICYNVAVFNPLGGLGNGKSQGIGKNNVREKGVA